jgi:hypothetical protein
VAGGAVIVTAWVAVAGGYPVRVHVTERVYVPGAHAAEPLGLWSAPHFEKTTTFSSGKFPAIGPVVVRPLAVDDSLQLDGATPPTMIVWSVPYGTV